MAKKIDAFVETLNTVLTGNGLLTTEIQQAGGALMAGKVPAKWSQLWEGPEHSLSWIKCFMKRAMQLDVWVDKVE